MINVTSATRASQHFLLTRISFKSLIQKLFSPALNQINLTDPQTARWICRLIPTTCPFERDIVLMGKKIGHIPALCKLNPLYEQFVELRFNALTFLADECGEDVTPYCQ
jgi:Mo-dependent nitrogenase C-terminus